jgi:Tfp pilus assembly protein FimT
MSPLFLAVLAIIAVFGVTSIARWLRMEVEHRRRPRRDRPER